MSTEENALGQSLLSHYGTYFASYYGEGVLTLEGGQRVNCAFETGQLTTGDVLLLCILPTPTSLSLDISVHSFEGTTSKGFRIYANNHFWEIDYLPDIPTERSSGTWAAFRLRKMFVQIIADNQAQSAHFGITNFRFNHKLECSGDIGRLSIRPVNGYDKIMKRLQTLKNIDITSEVIGKIPPNGDIMRLEKTVDDLCYILSVACGTKIQWVYCDQYDGSGECVSRTHYSRITKRYCPLAVVDPRNAEDIQGFIESAYSVYVAKKEAYRLNQGTIDAYLDAKAENDYLQMRGIKLAVVMEMLKAVFLTLPSTRLEEYIICEKQFKALIPDIKESIKNVLLKSSLKNSEGSAVCGNIRGLNRRSFSDLIKELFKLIGLRAKEEDIRLFIACRNKLVHMGRFYCETATPEERNKCKPLPTTTDEYFFLVHFLDRIFLKLLGYSGPYIDWSLPGSPTRRERV